MVMPNPFLQETWYCDYSDPVIKGLAADLQADTRDDREAAVAMFRFVRDAVRYEVGNWQRSAVETLAHASGTCTNSANLLVALLRSAGIPAGYGLMSVRGREYFGPIAPRRLSRLVAEVSRHVYACVELDGVWVRCDPSDDRALSLGTVHLNPQSRMVDWDGTRDAMLNLSPHHILDDRAPVADIDGLMAKPMRRAMRVPVRIANHYMDFLRAEGAGMRDAAEAEQQFERWLRGRHPALYLAYRALPAGAPQAEPAAS